ncbi:TPA: protein disulfide oxidoreductase [Photobacterium damselae]
MPKPSTNKNRLWRWGKELILMIVLLTIISIGLDLWRSQQIPKGQEPILNVIDINGEQINLAKLSADKPIIVYFWATWCSACKITSPSVNWLAQDYPTISIAIRSKDNETLKAYMKYHDYDFKVINDLNGWISKQWGISATPTIMVIKQGKIVSITTGVTSPVGIWLRYHLA